MSYIYIAVGIYIFTCMNAPLISESSASDDDSVHESI